MCKIVTWPDYHFFYVRTTQIFDKIWIMLPSHIKSHGISSPRMDVDISVGNISSFAKVLVIAFYL